jgi:predicted AlkP superfamily phosphohydrolase/phosphomutase
MKPRNVILGIDGIPYELMKNLSDKDIMPNFKELCKNYIFLRLKSSIPHISSVSWSSIITGKNPGEHGIFGFTDIIRNTYSLSFPNFNTLKCKPFWHNKPSQRHIILNVPSTYPAKELNGIHIAGFVALDLKKATYPMEYVEFLKNLKYEIDIDTSLAHEQSQELLFNELSRVLSIRKKTYQSLWNEFKWDNFMVVITSTDRFGHFLWNTYENENHENHDRCLSFFREVDDFIGDIYSKLGENDTFIILSDHGMESVNVNFNLNTFLEQEGYLKLGSEGKNYNRILKETKAFVLDPGRVYLNRSKRYPNGSVSESEGKSILDGLKNSLLDLKYEGKKVIKKIYEKEKIYHGPYVNLAPDLVIHEESGYQPKGNIGKINLFEKDNFSGMHNANAFILINKDIDIEYPSVENIIEFMV